MSLDHNPRKQFEAAVQYAVQIAEGYLRIWKDASINLAGMKLLELGPGADFAPQLVLASSGARVTLADKYLASWDADFHPGFYAAFLEQWTGAADAVRAAVKRQGYDGILQAAAEPAEHMPSLPTASFDLVQSNAVLEHVSDFRKVARELARVTKAGGVHAHQIDFRDHRDFDRPLEYLRLDQKGYAALRQERGGVSGTAKRLPELLDAFSRYFWIWKVNVNGSASRDYVASVAEGLPADSPYAKWPREMLRDIGAHVWLVRKENRVGLFGR